MNKPPRVVEQLRMREHQAQVSREVQASEGVKMPSVHLHASFVWAVGLRNQVVLTRPSVPQRERAHEVRLLSGPLVKGALHRQVGWPGHPLA